MERRRTAPCMITPPKGDFNLSFLYACPDGDQVFLEDRLGSGGQNPGGSEGSWASLGAQMVTNQPAVQETWVPSLGWEDPLEGGLAAHSSILAWRIPMDRGAWRAAACGVAGSAWLSD